jgi:hypothetical protein
MLMKSMAEKKFKYGPLPIPVITGEAARKFLEEDAKPLTEKQKELLKEADRVYRTIKRKE